MMSQIDLVALIVTIIGVASFATVVTILFKSHIKSQIDEIKIGTRDIEIVDLMLYEKDEMVVRKQKSANVAKTVLYYAFLAVVIPVFGLSLYSRIKNNVTKIGDQMIMVVASGSMSYKNEANDYLVTYNLNNQFNTYDLITLSPVKSVYDLRAYQDVIAFRNDKGINVIHRIISIENTDTGEVRFTTRGDSNSASDSYRPRFKDIIGKYTGRRIPVLGMFIMFFQSYSGIVTVLSVVYCVFMISHFNKKLDKATDERRELLSTLFDIETLDTNDAELMESVHTSVVYFKGYAYVFNSDGSTNKREMSEDEKAQIPCENPVKVDDLEENQTQNHEENCE